MSAVCRNNFAGEMLRGAEAGAGEGELAGIGSGGGDQLLDVIGREVRARDDDQAGGCDLRHRIERGERVVAQRLVHDRGDDLPRGHDAERVAVLVRAGDGLIAQRAGGTGPVLDHHRLAKLLLQRLRDDAADDIGAAAGSERDDDADGTLWPILRPCGARAAEPCGGRGNKQAASREHKLSSFAAPGGAPGHAAVIDDAGDVSILTWLILASCCVGHELNTRSAVALTP
jgi:hypothetical protein